MGFLDWLKREKKNARAERYSDPGLVVHYWDGGEPQEHPVKDISFTGAYIYTTERWYVGTIIALTIQKRTSDESTIRLYSKVVRNGPDGAGLVFLLRTKADRKALEGLMNTTVTGGMPAPPKHRTAEQGQSLVEYAFMVPFLFLLVVNCVNFGAFIYDWIEVANGARAGAQYTILSGASAGALTAATGTQIANVIKADMGSLTGTPTISVCTNNNGTLTTLTGTCTTTNTPADPEAPLYVLATVDVTYTYTPVTGDLSFPKLGIHATIPTTSIHRRTVMRMIQ